jgi:hypothetical protein
MANRKEECIRYIRETVGNSKVLVRLKIPLFVYSYLIFILNYSF